MTYFTLKRHNIKRGKKVKCKKNSSVQTNMKRN